MLRTILQERDIVAFSAMIQQFIAYCASDSDTKEFGQYFKWHYLNKVQSWAYCYRLRSGLNTSMYLERMHRTVKYLYLKGKFVKRLDKTINAIMKFVRDKLFERLITIYKGKVCTKLSDIRQRHKTSLTLNLESIIQNEIGWEVPSASSSEMYIIEEKKADCSCQLRCTECQACLHQYSCSCLDSCVKWNMCKHIHLICTYRRRHFTANAEQTGM